MYSRDTESATALFDALAEQNREKLSPTANEAFAGARRLIDIQCKIASYFVGFWTSPRGLIKISHGEPNTLLFATFHKNIFTSYAILVLTVKGLYGPARASLRTIFESLMIAKFSDTSENPTVLHRWEQLDTIYFTNSVLKKIVSPHHQPFTDMWKLLCDFSHATCVAGQFSMEIEEASEQPDFNLAVLNALLECNYHLLNSLLITPELSYMVKFHYSRMAAKTKRGYEISELRKGAHRQFTENRAFLGAESIRLITAYKRKWTLRA
jgi:hypothetical protein